MLVFIIPTFLREAKLNERDGHKMANERIDEATQKDNEKMGDERRRNKKKLDKG